MVLLQKYYYLFSSLWLTLKVFVLDVVKKKKKDGRQRSHFYNNSILSAGNLDLWCMREFPRLANLDKQISLEIQDSFRTGPT